MKLFKDVKLRISLLALGASMLIFTGVRLAIFLTNPSLFEPLAATEIVRAFWHGLQFDFYMTMLGLGPVLLLLNLPVLSKKWTQFWGFVLSSELIFLVGFLIADAIYFPQVGRHIGDEIIQISNDWGYIISYMIKVYWPVLLLLAGILAGTWIGVWRYVNRSPLVRRSIRQTTCILVSVILLFVLGLRGHLGGGKPLGVADVYNYVATASGAALSLNGAFTAYQIGRKGGYSFANSYPLKGAVEKAQSLFVAPSEKVIDADYPLMRQASEIASPAKKPNIFIVLLEGWSPYYVDAISHHNFGATPVFDKLVEGGVHFSQAYAVGQRSVLGFAAVLASVPLIPGLPMMGYGLEMTRLSPLPKHFSQAGYYTLFAQTSRRDSYRLCALASYLGMQESYGWEDIPQRFKYRQKAPFGYDHDALQFAADKIAQHAGKPFFTMVFTGITHEPFVSTLPEFDKYPYDTWEHGFLNSLSFADWSIGQLLARAKQDGWFEDTIFVFVADHTAGVRQDGTLHTRFHIPLIIYAPKYLAARQVDQVVSQLDIAPTLYALAGLTPSYTAFGRNMLDSARTPLALVSEGNTLGLITPQGSVRHVGKKILGVEASHPSFDAKKAEETLLALDKAAYTLLKDNRWYRAPAKLEAAHE